MGLIEFNTIARVDAALHSQKWTEDLIWHEETAGAIEIVEGKSRK